MIAESIPRAALTVAEVDELFALLDTHFEGVSRRQFQHDLNEKDWVLRVRQDSRLVGFSTLQVGTSMFEGESVNVLYSGDTIVAPEAWSSPVLARGWIAMVRRVQGERASEPWYWLLLSSGFRTYRFLPVFWRDFWPRHDAPTPPGAARLLSHLARERFAAAYLPDTGVVRFPHPQRLRASLAAVPEGKRRDAHVDYFLSRNPGHYNGDELVCITELGDDNLTAAGARMVRGIAQLAALELPS
ncbi:MAG: hypothetical protein ABMA00_15115 [Gemmatimonas sp.]